MHWNFRLLQSVLCSTDGRFSSVECGQMPGLLVLPVHIYQCSNKELLVSAQCKGQDKGMRSFWSKGEVAHMAVLWGLWAEPLWIIPSQDSPSWAPRTGASHLPTTGTEKQCPHSKIQTYPQEGSLLDTVPFYPPLTILVWSFFLYNKHTAYFPQESDTIH